MSVYRETADRWLKQLNPDLALDAAGTCYLSYGNARVLQCAVPKHGAFFHISSVLANAPLSPRLLPKALLLNIHQEKTNGGAVALDPVSEDLVISYRHAFANCDFTAFRNIIANFAATAATLSDELKSATAGATLSAGNERGLPRHGVFC